MNLVLVGCTHHDTTIEVRERLAFNDKQAGEFLQQYYDSFPNSEAVLLSTCNRTELYAAASQPSLVPSPDQLKTFLSESRGLDSDSLANLFNHSNEDAVRHLFSVAASLDSMVLGDAQILAQVKNAYRLAAEINGSMPFTHRAFQTANRVAKRVANETDVHRHRLSIPAIAIGGFAKRIFERLDDKSILVIGAGKMATETMRYIQSEGGKDIVVVNRSLDRATELAGEFDGRAKPWESLADELVTADLIVSATGATEHVVTAELFDSIKKLRHQRPLFILDLAVPRDIDPNIGDRLNVYLYSIEDLQQQCDINRQARQSQWPKAQKIIDQETAIFIREIQRRGNAPTIARLKEQARDVKDAELRRLMNRLGDVDPRQREEIEHSFHRLTNKILHPPLESLNDESETGKSGLLDALKRLFQLGD